MIAALNQTGTGEYTFRRKERTETDNLSLSNTFSYFEVPEKLRNNNGQWTGNFLQATTISWHTRISAIVMQDYKYNSKINYGSNNTTKVSFIEEWLNKMIRRCRPFSIDGEGRRFPGFFSIDVLFAAVIVINFYYTQRTFPCASPFIVRRDEDPIYSFLCRFYWSSHASLDISTRPTYGSILVRCIHAGPALPRS